MAARLIRAALLGLAALGCTSAGPSEGGQLQSGYYAYAMAYLLGSTPYLYQGMLHVTATSRTANYFWNVPGFSSGPQQATYSNNGWTLTALLSSGAAQHSVVHTSAGYQCQVQIFVSTQSVLGTCSLSWVSDTVVTVSRP